MNLDGLLLFIPGGVRLVGYTANPILVLLASVLVILPPSGLVGDATEAFARFPGPPIEGLLVVTLGNAPEMLTGGPCR
jgi:Ca2+:H+ antiporter